MKRIFNKNNAQSQKMAGCSNHELPASMLEEDSDDDESDTESMCGDFDEQGLIHSLDRKGITDPRALLESGGNSIDANATFWLAKISEECIEISDDGKGMTWDQAKQATKIYGGASSVEDRKSIGCFGLGLHAALKKLSRDGTPIIFTRAQDGSYIKITIPWSQIIELKQYTGLVRMTLMTQEERKYFKENLPKEVGTI